MLAEVPGMAPVAAQAVRRRLNDDFLEGVLQITGRSLMEKAELSLYRGVLALEAGDTERAAEQLRRSADDYGPASLVANYYLKQLRDAGTE